MRSALAIFAGIAALTFAVAAIAQTNVPTPTRRLPPQQQKSGPVTLQPNADDKAALARAQQNPMNERIRGLVLKLPKGRADAATINASAVPVLVPTEPRFIATLQVTNTGHGFIAQMTDGPAYVEVHGTNVAMRAPGNVRLPKTVSVAAADGGTLTNVLVEDSEMGVDVSFTRFGMGYSITIGCDDPAHDTHCTHDYALGLAKSMVVVGGGQP